MWLLACTSPRSRARCAAVQPALSRSAELMAGLRKAIAEGRLDDHIAEVKEGWARGESGGAAEPAVHADNTAPVAGIE